MAEKKTKGPWFGAQYDGECAGCDRAIFEGDMIRADGEGGWECEEWCGQDDPVDTESCVHAYVEVDDGNGHSGLFCKKCDQREELSEAPPTVEPMDDANAFLLGDPVEPVNVSGQPREKTGRSGYLITDPLTGEFNRYKSKPHNIIGFTRCTTLVKAATDTTGLTDWKQANVLIGATKRPDIAARAHGMTWEFSKDRLMDTVYELEDIAGAKNSARVGTEIHEMSERLDAGLITLDDIAPYYRGLISAYQEVLEDLELTPVPGLIERTTMTHQWGDVAGTFDRIYLHKPSGTYVMGDVKSGKGAETYGKSEIPAQLAVYTAGFNENGVYDWNDDTWHAPEVRVRTDWGLILHMPVQGDEAFTVTAKWVDLEWGRRVADLCARIRADRSGAPKFQVFDREGVRKLLGAPESAPWADLFSRVQTWEEAGELYNRAYTAGLLGTELNDLVELARQALSRG